jgi:dienelactone hydrolase
VISRRRFITDFVIALTPLGATASAQEYKAQPVRRPALVRSSVTVSFPDASGRVQLTGHLYRPEGEGQFPALVLLHGCSGISPTHHWWAATLRGWGYVALLVDSLGPRGETNVCDTLSVDSLYARMPDAYGSQSYLATQPFVDAARIGVMGWSHGGTTTLYAVDDVYLYKLRPKPFKAAIAFYPGCLMRLQQLNAPLLILIGENDDWTPAARCQRMELDPTTPYGVTLRVYSGAHHGFDGLRPVGLYRGHTVGREPAAAAKAEEEIQRFLTQHLLSVPQPRK